MAKRDFITLLDLDPDLLTSLLGRAVQRLGQIKGHCHLANLGRADDKIGVSQRPGCQAVLQ